MQDSNVYKAPESNLHQAADGQSPILNFKRFSAWGVFFLSVITLGFYGYYWLYNRGRCVNENTDKKLSFVPLIVTIVSVVALNIAPFIGGSVLSNLFVILGLYLTTIVSFYMCVFSTRNRLKSIINAGSESPVKVGPILTFFFSHIYLQYKINQAIDKQSMNNNDRDSGETPPLQQAA
ncbi:MAG TPA: hypothetical protein DD979_16060 [Gammaproteobacteria bacterium]|jgi:magnesium-transporting ATPase (P-type)|nr:hypothetical protein [Gammaproteobacteria bacterium]